jgi:hypothetical protein
MVHALSGRVPVERVPFSDPQVPLGAPDRRLFQGHLAELLRGGSARLGGNEGGDRADNIELNLLERLADDSVQPLFGVLEVVKAALSVERPQEGPGEP